MEERDPDTAVPGPVGETPRPGAEPDPQVAVELLRGVVDDASDAIIAIGTDRRIRLFNKAAEEMFGRTAADAQGGLLDVLLPSRFRGRHARHIEGFIGEDVERRLMSDRAELVGLRRDGTEFPVEVTIAKLTVQGEVVATAIVRDITERKRVEQTLAQQALHDALTGLPNRTLLKDRLAQALLRRAGNAGHVAVLFIDLDRFKLVNDSLGHDAGDRLLIRVAERIRAEIRSGDTAARIGGDEFVVLCPDIASNAEAVALAERLLAAISRPIPFDGIEIVPMASVGLVMADELSDPDRVLADADTAMYRAKETGGARCAQFDRTMRAATVERVRLESDLRRALESDDELAVWYQPIVNLWSDLVVGEEALVRWHHPEHGWLAAGAFVPHAEESRLVVALDAWVLRRICAQPHPGGGFVSVNLSARRLEHPAFLDSVVAALSAGTVAASQLVFEVTESVLLADLAGATASLHEIKRLGARLALDDFGTGYSSLAYVQRLPLDFLKIDRSFVERIQHASRDRAMAEGIVALAHGLGLTVIAEGVESERQRDTLREAGCDLAQGYLFGAATARPAGPSALVAGPARAGR